MSHDAFESLGKPLFAEHRINGLCDDVQEVKGRNAALYAAVQEQCIALVAHTKETHWLPMDGSAGPECVLEELAAMVYDHHLRNAPNTVEVDKSNSGAEFWVQVKHHSPPGEYVCVYV
jgi:hypothetical protein